MLPLDVAALLLELVGFDAGLLDDRRVDPADHHRDERPQADGDDRQHPALQPAVDEEEQGGGHRDDDQHVEGRQLGLDVGVAGALHRPPAGEVELEALQPVAEGLQQGHGPEDHRQVGLHLGRHPLERALDPDPAVEVVGDGRDEQDDDEGGERPLEDEAQERQREDVEADVGAELRVALAAEGDAVAEQDPGVPLRGEPAGGHDGQEGRHRHPHPAGVGADELAVPLDELLLRPGRPEPGLEPVGDDEVAEDQQEEDDGEDDRRAGPWPPADPARRRCSRAP